MFLHKKVLDAVMAEQVQNLQNIKNYEHYNFLTWGLHNLQMEMQE